MIGSVIENSQKKALEQSANGIVESARYFAISKEGTYNFKFNDTKREEEVISGEKLSYKGDIDADGDVYIDNSGNITLCLMNDKYYVYKNYNGSIHIGNRTETEYCISGYDAITDKYIAKLDDGSGISNTYSKQEINNLVDQLTNSINENTTEINTIDTSIDLTEYATVEELTAVNTSVSYLATVIASNSERLTALESK